jgi:hypothetical protein
MRQVFRQKDDMKYQNKTSVQTLDNNDAIDKKLNQ